MEYIALGVNILGTIATIISTVIAVKAKEDSVKSKEESVKAKEESKEILKNIRLELEKENCIDNKGDIIIENSGENSGVMSGIVSGGINKSGNTR